jgi:hypothetical protein
MHVLSPTAPDVFSCAGCQVQEIAPPRPRDPLPDFIGGYYGGLIAVTDHSRVHAPHP